MSDLRRATELMGIDQHAAALPLLQAALRQSEQRPAGSSSAETAAILHGIGECFYALKDCQAAAEHCRRAATICNYSFKDRVTASLQAAKAYDLANLIAEVESQVKSSLSILDAAAATGVTTPKLLKRHRADVFCLWSKVLRDSGRYSEALPIYEENAAHYESLGDTENLVSCLLGLGEVYFHQGLSQKLLHTAQRAHTLDPRDGVSLINLGSLFSRLHRHHEALECYKKAMGFESRQHGTKSRLYAIILERIGTAYADLDQREVALTWYHKALAEYEKLGDTNTREFAQLLNNSGVAYMLTNNIPEALASYTRSLAILRHIGPPDHPGIVDCMRNIAVLNALRGNSDAAAVATAAAALTARRSQVQCAAAGCPRKLKADGTPLDYCGGCKRCFYCSKACQSADWKAGHKAECKTLSNGK